MTIDIVKLSDWADRHIMRLVLTVIFAALFYKIRPLPVCDKSDWVIGAMTIFGLFAAYVSATVTDMAIAYVKSKIDFAIACRHYKFLPEYYRRLIHEAFETNYRFELDIADDRPLQEFARRGFVKHEDFFIDTVYYSLPDQTVDFLRRENKKNR